MQERREKEAQVTESRSWWRRMKRKKRR